jgi:hypothetical protein
VTQLVYPAISLKTPLGSLSGFDLILSCPKCGDRIKSVAKLCEVVHLCQELGDLLPRLSCDVCRSKPVRLRAMNVWVRKFDRETVTEDLSFLLQRPMVHAA